MRPTQRVWMMLAAGALEAACGSSAVTGPPPAPSEGVPCRDLTPAELAAPVAPSANYTGAPAPSAIAPP